MTSVKFSPTTIMYSGKQFFAYPENDAFAISKWQSDNNNSDEENVPGGVITGHDDFLEKMSTMFPGAKFEWRDVSSESSVGSSESASIELDSAVVSSLRNFDSGDLASILLSAALREFSELCRRRGPIGKIIDDASNLISNLRSVVPRNASVSLELMTHEMKEVSSKLRLADAVTTLRKKGSNVTLISPFQAPIFFSEHDGLTFYYDSSNNYVCEIVGKIMIIHQLGYTVFVDEGFDDECEKVKFRVARFDKLTARAVVSLSKILRGSISGKTYNFNFQDSFQLAYHSYVGFQDYSIPLARRWRDKLVSILSSSGGSTMTCEDNWHQWSRSHFAFAWFFKERLNADKAFLSAIDSFIDDSCLFNAEKYSTQVQELVTFRRDIESDFFSFVTNISRCHDYVSSAATILQQWGATPKGLQQNRLNRDTVLDFKYPTFKENDDRLEAGRKSRFGDPGATLNKQYPVFSGGPAIVLGEATSDKIARILALLRLLAGPGVLKEAVHLLYAGVTNFDRMLEIICSEWVKDHSDNNDALKNITLLDKNQPSPPKWSLRYKDHVFSLKTLTNLDGQFVCEDLIDHLNAMDVSKGREAVIISDANVLGTDSNTYLAKNEFAVSKVSLGDDELDKWISERNTKWTGQATSTAKYIIKTVSKFKAGVLKLHIFDLSIDFFTIVGQKLMEKFKTDSFLWKNGRGHNSEFFFYFFPKVVDRSFSMFRASPFYLPALLSMCAVSEITRHVAYYAPHRQAGKSKFGENGVLDENPNYPILVPDYHQRVPVPIEVGGYKFLGVKGLRSGLKTLVGGIQISQPEIADVSEFDFVDSRKPASEKPPPPQLTEVPSGEGLRKPKPVGSTAFGVSGEICTDPEGQVVSAKTPSETSFLPVPGNPKPYRDPKDIY